MVKLIFLIQTTLAHKCIVFKGVMNFNQTLKKMKVFQSLKLFSSIQRLADKPWRETTVLKVILMTVRHMRDKINQVMPLAQLYVVIPSCSARSLRPAVRSLDMFWFPKVDGTGDMVISYEKLVHVLEASWR